MSCHRTFAFSFRYRPKSALGILDICLIRDTAVAAVHRQRRVSHLSPGIGQEDR